jgi:hypothetical protein
MIEENKNEQKDERVKKLVITQFSDAAVVQLAAIAALSDKKLDDEIAQRVREEMKNDTEESALEFCLAHRAAREARKEGNDDEHCDRVRSF